MHCNQVPYDTNGFLEKNRDPLQTDIIQLLSSCTCQVLQLFASKMLNPSPKPIASSQPGALDTQKQSVGTKFKVNMLDYDLMPNMSICLNRILKLQSLLHIMQIDGMLLENQP